MEVQYTTFYGFVMDQFVIEVSSPQLVAVFVSLFQFLVMTVVVVLGEEHQIVSLSCVIPIYVLSYLPGDCIGVSVVASVLLFPLFPNECLPFGIFAFPSHEITICQNCCRKEIL